MLAQVQFAKRCLAASLRGPNQPLLCSFSTVLQSMDSTSTTTMNRFNERNYHAFDVKQRTVNGTQPYEHAENEELTFSPHNPPLVLESYLSNPRASKHMDELLSNQARM